jgi:OmpA-OmpF porin, OOP family
MQPSTRCFFIYLLAGFVVSAHGEDRYTKDMPGGKDHPLISRYQGATLFNYGVQNFAQLETVEGKLISDNNTRKPEKSRTIEGTVSSYFYFAPKDRSPLEVFRNYQASLAKSGFKTLYMCEAKKCEADNIVDFSNENSRESATWKDGYSPTSATNARGDTLTYFISSELTRDRGNAYVQLWVLEPGSSQDGHAPIFMQIVEMKAMETGKVMVDANAMSKGLDAEGKIALYGIYFDTGKAIIKPESKAQLDEMAKLLQANAKLNVFIVGHTDNQGNFAQNFLLAKQRAEAVKKTLVSDYKIDAKRLDAQGAANLSPVATNDSDAGRAKNRRVELVKQ